MSNPPNTVQATMTYIERQFGKGSIFLPSDNVEPMDVIHTGSPDLDAALGIGGWPKGRICEVFGGESSGKTTLALHAIAETQRADGGVAAFLDLEHALDLTYAREIGVNIERLLVSQPDTAEQALEITDALVRSGAVALVVIDSVAALTPKCELEGAIGDEFGGVCARILSQALRKLTAAASRCGCTVLVTNQLRAKTGVVFGNPMTTPGGNALKFYASARVELRKIGSVQDGDDVVGSRVRATVVKNKCAAPFNQAELHIRWGRGVMPPAGMKPDGHCEHGHPSETTTCGKV